MFIFMHAQVHLKFQRVYNPLFKVNSKILDTQQIPKESIKVSKNLEQETYKNFWKYRIE